MYLNTHLHTYIYLHVLGTHSYIRIYAGIYLKSPICFRERRTQTKCIRCLQIHINQVSSEVINEFVDLRTL